MPFRDIPVPGGRLRRVMSSAAVVPIFALLMTAALLGVMTWKALDAQAAWVNRNSDIQNLALSLAEQASHGMQAVDIAMSGMVDLLRYRDAQPDRFNAYLAETAKTLPQLRGIGVTDAEGNWRYSSMPE